MQNELHLLWFFLIPLFAVAIVLLSSSMKNDKTRKKILEWLAKNPAGNNDLRSRLKREGIRLSKWRFHWIMNKLACDQRITLDDNGKWIIPFEKPVLTAHLRRQSQNSAARSSSSP